MDNESASGMVCGSDGCEVTTSETRLSQAEERLKRSIDILVNAESLPRTPTIDEVWTSAFLPPVDDLPKKLF